MAIFVLDLFHHSALPCEYCQTIDKPREWVPSMTAYHTDLPHDHPDHPNRDVYLCKDCEEQHTEFWTAMWDEYYNSQGY